MNLQARRHSKTTYVSDSAKTEVTIEELGHELQQDIAKRGYVVDGDESVRVREGGPAEDGTPRIFVAVDQTVLLSPAQCELWDKEFATPVVEA